MSWTRLIPPTRLDSLPAALRQLGNQLAADVDYILRERATLDAAAATFRETGQHPGNVHADEDPVGTLSQNQFLLAENHRGEIYALLTHELKTRERLADFLGRVPPALGEAADSAQQDLDKFKTRLENDLVKLGYDRPTSPPEPGQFQVGHLMVHPRYQKLRNRVAALREQARDRSHANENTAAIEAVRRQLAEMRERVTAA